MSQLQRCERCVGRKVVTALGGLQKECPDCLGVGWVKAPEEASQKNMAEETSNEVAAPKKRGRKPKMKNKDFFGA